MPTANTKTFKDHLNRKIEIRFPPQRIISVVPSQTEFLYDLGMEDEVVGITKFCIHPEKWFRNKTRVGGTKSLNIEKIKALNPDLIIANKEENNLEEIEELSEMLPVWISDIKTLEDAYGMMEEVGRLTAKTSESETLIKKINSSFDSFRTSATNKPLRCAYFIWWNPVMSINSNTFIHDMIGRCGWINVFEDRQDSRYPEISDEQLQQANPDLLLLSSEPFPFSQKHVAHFQKLLPNTKIELVNGEMFSWYGSRLLYSADYFKQLTEHILSLGGL